MATAALTSDVDICVSHEQHGQRVDLGGVPHKHPTVGLDRHEVREPAAVELGGLPAQGTATSAPGRDTASSGCGTHVGDAERSSAQPAGAAECGSPLPRSWALGDDPPVDGGLVEQDGASLGPIRVAVGFELPLTSHFALSHLKGGEHRQHLHNQQPRLAVLRVCTEGCSPVPAENVLWATRPGSHQMPRKGQQTVGGICHLGGSQTRPQEAKRGAAQAGGGHSA